MDMQERIGCDAREQEEIRVLKTAMRSGTSRADSRCCCKSGSRPLILPKRICAPIISLTGQWQAVYDLLPDLARRAKRPPLI